MSLYYFGYGANRDARMMQSITGKSLEGRPGYVDGFELAVQKLDHVPILPQKVLRAAWGNHFESYVIRKGKGRVYGVLWKITTEDRLHIKTWELIPEGWYTDSKIEVVIEDGSKVPAVTDLVENQKIDRVVDGRSYTDYLMPEGKMWQHAKRIRMRL